LSRPADTPLRAATVVAWTAIIAGALGRMWLLANRGSLWLDEASLALNVMMRSFGELMRPLDWGQAAPVGFLWIQHAVSAAPDVPDLWLRIVPWCAGAMLPWLLWTIGRRMIGTGAGALAAVASAGSLLALRYSTEAKPYAGDAAVAAALVLLARNVIDAPQDRRHWWALAVGLVLGVLLSLPAVFVVAALTVALASVRTVRESPYVRRIGLPALALAALTFGALWTTSYGGGASSAPLRAYWAPVMLDVTSGDFVVRVVRVVMELAWIPLRWTGSLVGTAVGGALWMLGLVIVARRRRSDAILLAAPVAFAATASLIGAYPLSDRLAFFAVPGVWVAQAAALTGVRNMLLSSGSIVANARMAAAFVVLTAIALATWQYTDSERFTRDPGALEPTRALFAQVDRDAGRVPIYVFARSAPAWILATHEGAWRSNARLQRWLMLAGRRGAPGFENAARTLPVAPFSGDSMIVTSAERTELVGLAPGVEYHIAGAPSAETPSAGWAEEETRRLVAVARPDVWIVASHFFAGSPRNELRPLVEAATAAGLRIVEERHAGNDVVALRLSR
jgi:hypothetical protein